MERVVRIGKYLARRALGAGSFATVWLADDELLDAQVAVKVLADNWARHPDVRRRFIEEAKLLRRIDHERVVRVHDVDELPDGRPYFVMTWADRGTLQERLTHAPGGQRRLGIDEAVAVAIEICECLAVVHDFGAVHRDVKPSNVLFRSVRSHERAAAQRRGLALGDEMMVLGDFGLAKDLAAASGFTQAAGTPAYMAPEQARSTSIIDRRVDVFGATAVLYEMLVGHPAIAASTLSDVRRDSGEAGGGVAPVRSLRPDVPPTVAAVIARGLAFDPDQRYASAVDLAQALRDAALAAARRDPPAQAVRSQPSTPADIPAGAAGRVADLVASVRRLALAPADVLQRIESGLADPVRVLMLPASAWPDLSLVSGAKRVGGGVDDVGNADMVVLALSGSDAAELAATVRTALRSRPDGPAAVVVAVDDPAVAGLADVRALTPDVLATEDARRLVDSIIETLIDRRSLLRAAVGLAALDAAVDPALDPATSGRATQARDVRDAIDSLRLELPALAEIDALRADTTGRWMLAAPLRREVRRLLLWSAPAQRLERSGASTDELRDATRQALERWRTLHNTDRLPFSARDVAELIERSLERLWMELGPGA